MISKKILRILILLITIPIFVIGCELGSINTTIELMQVSPTQFIKTTSANIKKETKTPTQILEIIVTSPTQRITPLPIDFGRLELTFTSDRKPGYTGIYSMEVTCLDEDIICLGESILLFEKKNRFENLPEISSHVWSPDGNRVVFANFSRLYIANANGENEIQIPGPEGKQSFHQSFPQWSPDGKQIAYTFTSEIESTKIVIYDLEKNQSKFVVDKAISPVRYYWLPGNRIAYVENVENEDWYIYQITIADENEAILQRFPKNYSDFMYISDVAFSMDGERFVFSADKMFNSGGHLFLINFIGTSIIQLTKGDEDNLSPIWSPIGNWIVFSKSIYKDSKLYTKGVDLYAVKIDSSREIRLTDMPSTESSPAWRSFH